MPIRICGRKPIGRIFPTGAYLSDQAATLGMLRCGAFVERVGASWAFLFAILSDMSRF